MSGDSGNVPYCATEESGASPSSDGGPSDDNDSSVEGYKFETAPFDPRFPNQNQTKYCGVSFIEYQRCIKLRGEDYGPCQYFKKVYTSICPKAWVQKWEDQIAEGKSPFLI